MFPLCSYVALPFIHVEGALAPGQAVECPTGTAAIRRAEAMSANQCNAGAVAFSVVAARWCAATPERSHDMAQCRGDENR
jgi:hypothetical protein